MADTKRVTVTLSSDEFERLTYWAKSKGISINEYLRDSIALQIDYDNHNYHNADILNDKANQIIDGFSALENRITTVQHLVSLSFKSLMATTRGDDYLFDKDPEEQNLKTMEDDDV